MSKQPSKLLPDSFFGTDLIPLAARSVGFDHLFDVFDSFKSYEVPKYPPYNITKTSEDDYQVVVAVAGLSKDVIKVEHDKQELIISHSAPTDDSAENKPTFIHKGLAARDFILRFKLASDVEVVDAVHENGLLTVNLKHVTTKNSVKVIPIM